MGGEGGEGDGGGFQNVDTDEQTDKQTDRQTYLHSSRPRDRTLELCFLCTPEHSMHSKHP